ncbi:hypothetical protein EDB89DRAFT_2024779 [Lactarius sanguifluus]|nr:hypothetical protein EDB89DRAFT_2024779 [Lactarius sanguifluus]
MSLSSRFSRILTARPLPPHWHAVLALLPLLPPPLTLGLPLLFFTLCLCRSGSFQEGTLLLGLLRCGSGGDDPSWPFCTQGTPGPSSRSAGSHSRCVRGGGCSAAGSCVRAWTSTRRGRLALSASGGGDSGAVGTPSRHLAPRSRRAQLGVSETRREEENCTFELQYLIVFHWSRRSWAVLIYGVQEWAINSNSTLRHRGDELLRVGTQPEQPEQPWVQGGATLLVMQTSAQRITSDTGSLRSKMHRSKVAKGVRWCRTLEDVENEGN